MSKFLQKYLMPTFAPETGAGGGDGGAAAAAAAAAAASAGKPWHDGVEADTVGFWQNKGYKVDDPKALATDLTKQYRELERHIGAPPDQILRLPKADAKPEDIKAFWSKLGAPADAKEYDFSGIKFGRAGPRRGPLPMRCEPRWRRRSCRRTRALRSCSRS
jgi:hypothetical protein